MSRVLPRCVRCRARGILRRGVAEHDRPSRDSHLSGPREWSARTVALMVHARARAHAASLGRSRRNVVIVSVPPDILDYPTSTDMVVREGSNVTLRCAATGTPEPTVTWRREAGGTISLSNWQGTYLRIATITTTITITTTTTITTLYAASLDADCRVSIMQRMVATPDRIAFLSPDLSLRLLSSPSLSRVVSRILNVTCCSFVERFVERYEAFSRSRSKTERESSPSRFALIETFIVRSDRIIE